MRRLNPFRKTKFIGSKMFIFLVQMTTKRISNRNRLMDTLYMMALRTYFEVYTYILVQTSSFAVLWGCTWTRISRQSIYRNYVVLFSTNSSRTVDCDRSQCFLFR